jgi:excisionase family DNA binding protein
MNTSEEIERLQNALANLATVMAKIISDRVDAAVSELQPTRLPANPSDPANNRVLNKKQVAELLNVTVRSVDEWMKRGILPYLKIGRTVRFKSGDIVRHLDETATVDHRRTSVGGSWR